MARDYKAEYQRRLARGAAKGLSRSQARGHARSAEPAIRPRRVAFDPQLEAGLRALRRGESLTSIAKAQRVSPERLRRYVKSLSFVEKRGRRFVVGTDTRLRQVQFYADSRLIKTIVRGYEAAALAGSYWEAVGKFLRTNDTAYLTPFVGVQIADITGRTYTLETRPNALYRRANAGGESFEQIYQLVL